VQSDAPAQFDLLLQQAHEVLKEYFNIAGQYFFGLWKIY